ncbi:nicotinamide-nucleotide amidase [Marinobacter sp. DUT-1]|uniref:nicotinamide-nucleotide amidase n=1 Tax=Marinobacter sp. DUT-1 TaxID=3412037 RepID=UPI003D180DF7
MKGLYPHLWKERIIVASDQELEQAGDRLGELLKEQGRTIATAESCTGGWVAKVLTDRPGSSAYVMAGLVTYSNGAKQALLGVSAETLEQHGAVSEPVVRQMVAGAVQAAGVDVAVAISGVAGPGGGSPDKPVGTVWFAWGSGQDQTEAVVKHFDGDRDEVRRQSVLFALQAVTSFLEGA